MRHFLTTALLGASLAFGASAAMAESNSAANEFGDNSPSYVLQAPDQPAQFVPAGPTTSQPTWLQQYRLENIGQ
jgi:hypothetical protein